MDKSKIGKLVLAVSMAGMLTTPSVSFAANARDVAQQMLTYVRSNDTTRAVALGGQLKQLGVVSIEVGKFSLQLKELNQTIEKGNPQAIRVVVARLTAMASEPSEGNFHSEKRLLKSVEVTTKIADSFPTGSAG